MPRSEARFKVAIWSNEGWRNLSKDAQWLYLALVSQGDVSLAGVLPYAPRRWAKLAQGLDEDATERFLCELEAAEYVKVDRDTMELAIRRFPEHDNVLTNEKLRRGMWTAWGAVVSESLREFVVDWLPPGVAEEAVERRWLDRDALSDGVSDAPSSDFRKGLPPSSAPSSTSTTRANGSQREVRDEARRRAAAAIGKSVP